RSAVPLDSKLNHNLFISPTAPFTLYDDISGLSFNDNLSNFATKTLSPFMAKGIRSQDITMKRAANGLLYPSDENFVAYG
ncbi:hypothetical protein, partial [Psychrobacter sp. TB55-MNA-CIBAN-0194]|uniref:hypothetical protein n=1 Tax=Psychrobacter sp. TB55-MNA-CIBAN-0194 TaxID=3140445 RepID=UPI003329F362